jgi:hypothetical protein
VINVGSGGAKNLDLRGVKKITVTKEETKIYNMSQAVITTGKS